YAARGVRSPRRGPRDRRCAARRGAPCPRRRAWAASGGSSLGRCPGNRGSSKQLGLPRSAPSVNRRGEDGFACICAELWCNGRRRMNDASTAGLLDVPGMLPVALFTLALLATFLVASWFAAWYDERTKRATAQIRKGALLPAGFGSFFGVARALDQRPAGELV